MSDVSIEYECDGKSGELSGDMLLGVSIEYDGEGSMDRSIAATGILAPRTVPLGLMKSSSPDFIAARSCLTDSPE